MENEDGKIYLKLTEENLRNLCMYIPDFKKKFYNELPKNILEDDSANTKDEKVEESLYGARTNALLMFVGDGKSRKQILEYCKSEYMLNNCIQDGYLHRPRSAYYVVTDAGYKKLKEFKYMDRKMACAVILKYIRKHKHRTSNPEIAEALCMGKERCRSCLKDIRKYIDDGLLDGYKYENQYPCGVKSFYVYWFNGD